MFFRAVKFVRKDLEFLLQEKVLLFFALKSLSGETLCKFAQIFPPKDLVYFWKFFLDTFLVKVIVSKTQCWLLYCVVIVIARNEIKGKLKNTFYSLVCFVIFNSSSWVNNFFFFKNTTHAPWARRIFLSLLEPHSNHIFVKTRH